MRCLARVQRIFVAGLVIAMLRGMLNLRVARKEPAGARDRVRRPWFLKKITRPPQGGIVVPEAWDSYWWDMGQAGDAGGRRPSVFLCTGLLAQSTHRKAEAARAPAIGSRFSGIVQLERR